MEWVVTTGKTVDEAKEAALDELGVDDHDAEFEILEEPRQGLFGRQRGEARVRARVRPNVPRPKADRRDRRRKRTDAPGTPPDGTTDAAPAEAPAAPVKATRAKAPSRARTTAAAVPAADSDATPEGPPKRARRRPATTTAVEAVAVGGGRDDDEAGTPADGGEAVGEQELDLTQQAEIAEAFLQGLLEKFALPARTAVATLDEETFEVHVTGEELGLLIGPKGQTLQAVQEITRTVVQRRASNRTGRILVDVAGYRVRRREALERFTRQVADDVRATGVHRALEPMSAADRKIVHDTANDIDGVRTISEGEDPRRRVVIVPDAAAPDADAG